MLGCGLPQVTEQTASPLLSPGAGDRPGFGFSGSMNTQSTRPTIGGSNDCYEVGGCKELGAVRGTGGPARFRGRPLSLPTWPDSAPPRAPRRLRPLLNMAGGGGSGLAAHAGGVHGLGGDEI